MNVITTAARRGITLIVLAGALTSCRTETQYPETPRPMMTTRIDLTQTIPIVAWYGIPTEQATEARYRELAATGITWCVVPDGRPEVIARHLDLAEKVGIKLIIQHARMLSEPRAVAAEFKDRPGLGAYFLRDEPNTEMFPQLAAALQALHEADPAHPSYSNLYPTYATKAQLGAASYEEYVDTFLRVLQPEFFGFDHYGFIEGGEILRRDYFENLEIISARARDRQLPFWAFALTTSHAGCPVPTEGQLRLQIYSDLAYGARGIQYFTYWTPPPDGPFVFKDGPIDIHGNRTSVYELLCKLNPEITRLTPCLVRLKSQAVYHSETSRPGTHSLPPGLPVTRISGSPVLLGVFQDAGGATWGMIVNRSWTKPASTTLVLDPKVQKLVEVDKISGRRKTLEPTRQDSKPQLTLTLEPGDGRLFEFKTTR